MVAEAIDRKQLKDIVDDVGDFVHGYAPVQFEIDYQFVNTIELFFFDSLDHDVRLGHVDQGHREADVSVDVAIVAD